MSVIWMHVMVFKVRICALFHKLLEFSWSTNPCLFVCVCLIQNFVGDSNGYICVKCINSLIYYHGSSLMLVYHKLKHAGNPTCLFHVLFMYAISHGLVHICLNVWLFYTYVVNKHLHTDKICFFIDVLHTCFCGFREHHRGSLWQY